MKKPSTLAAVVFVLGCATGGAASHYVGSAGAQLPPSGEAWQYACFSASDSREIVQTANGMGAEGWEMAAATLSGSRPLWCFKRIRRQ